MKHLMSVHIPSLSVIFCFVCHSIFKVFCSSKILTFPFCLVFPIYSKICFCSRLNDNLRPVSLKKIVIGYPYDSKDSEFKFDLMLSYKLHHVIQTYSERKPTLVVRYENIKNSH